jgi:ankyrin repeat protein
MHLPVVKFLLALGSDATALNRRGMTALDSFVPGYANLGSRPLEYAVGKLEGSAELMQLLIKAGARPTSNTLSDAAALIDLTLVETILDAVLESGTPVSDLDAALSASIDAGRPAVARMLLERGVNPHATRVVDTENET